MAPARANLDGPSNLADCIKTLRELPTVAHDFKLEQCISYLEQLKARLEMVRRLSKELLK